DDAAEGALLSALVKLDQYDPRRPFGPWLLRIVANAATDRRRRRKVRRAESLDPALVAGGTRPDAAAEQRALAERLRGALAELSERRRLAVVLVDVEGYLPAGRGWASPQRCSSRLRRGISSAARRRHPRARRSRRRCSRRRRRSSRSSWPLCSATRKEASGC